MPWNITINTGEGVGLEKSIDGQITSYRGSVTESETEQMFAVRDLLTALARIRLPLSGSASGSDVDGVLSLSIYVRGVTR